jgi:hypothetical protein
MQAGFPMQTHEIVLIEIMRDIPFNGIAKDNDEFRIGHSGIKCIKYHRVKQKEKIIVGNLTGYLIGLRMAKQGPVSRKESGLSVEWQK